MFRSITSLSGAVQRQTDGLESIRLVLSLILDAYESSGGLESRLAELERGRSQWEAEVEAQFIRAESKFKAARNAEERQRTMTNNAEALAGNDESEDAIRDDYLEFLRRNGEAGAAEAVQPVLPPVAADAKTRALQAKFGTVI